MTKETVVKTIYEKGIPAEEIIEESKTVQSAVKDEKGNEKEAGTQESTGTTTSTYKIPETTTTTSTVPGKVTAWSVSVMVDLTKDIPVTAANEDQEEDKEAASTTAETELIMSVDDVKDIVRTAIGPSLINDENLTVKHIKFNRPQTAFIEEQAGTYDKLVPIIEIARQSSMGILAVCALLVLKIFTGAGKKVAEDSTPSNSQSLPMSTHQMLPAGYSNDSMAAFREQISHRLRENPEQVRQLFSSWLSEGN
jgi:flagellar biosynthesis/type III secretory pathway M-ring protein FliF/YscJ